jgi:hypothetical protein
MAASQKYVDEQEEARKALWAILNTQGLSDEVKAEFYHSLHNFEKATKKVALSDVENKVFGIISFIQ